MEPVKLTDDARLICDLLTTLRDLLVILDAPLEEIDVAMAQVWIKAAIARTKGGAPCP